MECKVRIGVQIFRRKFYTHTYRLDQSKILSQIKKQKQKSWYIMCLFFTNLKYDYFIRNVKWICNKLWLVEYKVKHKKNEQNICICTSWEAITCAKGVHVSGATNLTIMLHKKLLYLFSFSLYKTPNISCFILAFNMIK